MNKSMLLVSSLFGITMNIIIILYIFKLEADKTCDCSKNWMREFIKYYAMITLFLIVINSIILKNPKDVIKNKGLFIYSLICSILGLIYSVILIIYYIKLRSKKNCECSELWHRKALLYPIILFIFGFFIGLINSILKK